MVKAPQPNQHVAEFTHSSGNHKPASTLLSSSTTTASIICPSSMQVNGTDTYRHRKSKTGPNTCLYAYESVHVSPSHHSGKDRCMSPSKKNKKRKKKGLPSVRSESCILVEEGPHTAPIAHHPVEPPRDQPDTYMQTISAFEAGGPG